jgi:hypothetical protein
MYFCKTPNRLSIVPMPLLHSFKINTWEQLINALICGGVMECIPSSTLLMQRFSILKVFLVVGCGLCFVQDLDTPQEHSLI